MLVLFLRNPAALNEPAFGALSCATYVKVRTAGLAIGILLILGGTALVKVWLLPVA